MRRKVDSQRDVVLATWVRFESGAELAGDIVNDAGHKNQRGVLGSVMDGRTSLPAAKNGLTSWVLTIARKSPLAERMELTLSFCNGPKCLMITDMRRGCGSLR